MKISKIIYSIALAGIILGMGSCSMFKKSAADDSISLKYTLSEGQQVVLTSETASTIETEQMGQQMLVEMNSTTELVNKILKASEGNLNVEMEFKV